MKVEVSDVVDEKGLNPIIVNFENGKINNGLETELQCEMLKNNKNDRCLAACANSLIYIGELGSEDDLQYNFLIVRKKNSTKVRLLNLDKVCMRPYLKSTKDEVDKTLSKEKITNSELNKKFGSKKTKRITEQRERLKLDIENVKEQLEQTVAAIKTDDYFLNASQVVEHESAYTPPINRCAETVQEVYQLDNLIPQNVLDALEVELNSILACDDFENLGLFKFCKQNLEIMKELSSSKSILNRCKIIVYINYLLKFLVTPAKSMSKKYVLCKTSRDVDSHILNNFSMMSGTNRTRPMSMRDKTVCYILVLAMIASNYNLELETLAIDMKVGIKKLQDMSKILAFTITGPKTVSLKLPLPAPKVSNAKRKRQ